MNLYRALKLLLGVYTFSLLLREFQHFLGLGPWGLGACSLGLGRTEEASILLLNTCRAQQVRNFNVKVSYLDNCSGNLGYLLGERCNARRKQYSAGYFLRRAN